MIIGLKIDKTQKADSQHNPVVQKEEERKKERTRYNDSKKVYQGQG